MSSNPVEVEVREIEAELRQLWKNLATEASGEAMMRACVLTLIVYAGSPWDSEEAQNTLGSISQTHPSRILIIRPRSRSSDVRLKASVETRCHRMSGGRRHVCGEIVHIQAPENSLPSLPGLVRRLLVPDLPAVLWWRGKPEVNHPLFSELKQLADHLILHSGDLQADTVDLSSFGNAVQESEMVVSDLNWLGLNVWRTVIFRLFDPVERRPSLKKLVELEVRHSDWEVESLPIAPLLLVGWFASRLDWSLDACSQEDGTVFLSLKNKTGETVSVQITGSSTGEDLRSIQLQTKDGIRFLVRERQNQVEASVLKKEQEQRCPLVKLGETTESNLVMRALESSESDSVYLEALAFALECNSSLQG